MKKVIIADDENLSREILSNYIPWNEYDCEVIALCQDGKNAYDVACELKPDIIISDIKMPKMDGIELFQNLKQILPNTLYILVTAFADKKYLKSAITLQVSGFIEKPFDMDEINSLLESLIHDCNRKDEVIKAEKYIVSRKLLTLFLMSSSSHEELAQEIAKYNALTNYKQSLSTCGSFLCLVLKLFDCDYEKQYEYPMKMINFFEEYLLKNKINSISIALDNNRLISILHFNNFTKDEIIAFLNNFITIFGNHFKDTKIGISVGTIENDYTQTLSSLNNAELYLDRFFYKSHSCVIDCNNDRYFPSINMETINSIIDNIINSLKHIDEKSVLECLDDFFNELSLYQNTPVDEVKNIVLSLIYSYKKIGINLNITNIKEIFININSKIANSVTINEINNILKNISISLLKKIEHKYSKTSKNDEILLYIEDNLGNYDLSVKFLANHFFVSQSYLCSVFKKETSHTINEYIINKRMDFARELLETSNLNICKIAEKVGFNDAKYFSKVFRKKIGVLPKEIREHGFK